MNKAVKVVASRAPLKKHGAKPHPQVEDEDMVVAAVETVDVEMEDVVKDEAETIETKEAWDQAVQPQEYPTHSRAQLNS